MFSQAEHAPGDSKQDQHVPEDGSDRLSMLEEHFSDQHARESHSD